MTSISSGRPSAARAYFSESYALARLRFGSAAAACGARLDELHLEPRAPDGSPLSIDIAWLGARRPDRALIHSCGLHGVEGFAGSAIQLALLERLPALPSDGALILVHVLNPFGMAWLRRANENNVDLNRNFSRSDAPRPGASDAYRRLEAFLNPPSAPSSDGFLLRAAAIALRHGIAPLKQAIAEGQYEFSKGLFYGGAALEPGPRAYMDWLAANLRSVRQLFAIDVHTGLGRWGKETIFSGAEPVTQGIGYRVYGGYSGAFTALKPDTPVSVITEEFGTYSALRVLHALREENRLHHYGRARDIDHPAKRRLLGMFAPRSGAWRDGVVEQGVRLAQSSYFKYFSIAA